MPAPGKALPAARIAQSVVCFIFMANGSLDSPLGITAWVVPPLGIGIARAPVFMESGRLFWSYLLETTIT
jgi:hypothetical protein